MASSLISAAGTSKCSAERGLTHPEDHPGRRRIPAIVHPSPLHHHPTVGGYGQSQHTGLRLKKNKRAQEKSRERLTSSKRPSSPIHPITARTKLTKLRGILQ